MSEENLQSGGETIELLNPRGESQATEAAAGEPGSDLPAASGAASEPKGATLPASNFSEAEKDIQAIYKRLGNVESRLVAGGEEIVSGVEIRIQALEAQMEELLSAGGAGAWRMIEAFEARLSELESAVASHAGPLFSQSEHDGLAALKRWFAGFLGRRPPAALGGLKQVGAELAQASSSAPGEPGS